METTDSQFLLRMNQTSNFPPPSPFFPSSEVWSTIAVFEVGSSVGKKVGCRLGDNVGLLEGSSVGEALGSKVGETVSVVKNAISDELEARMRPA